MPLERATAQAASVSACRSQRDPGRVRPERRLPPEALLPGQIPAHDARWPAVGKRVMSRPHSATSASAVRRATPGIVSISSMISANGAQRVDDPGVQRRDGVIKDIDVGQQLGDERAVMIDLEAVGERFAQLRDLRTHPSLGQLGQVVRIGHPGEQRFQHRPRRLRVGLPGDAGQLDPGVLHHLLQPLNGTGPFIGLGLAQPSQVPQPTDRRRWHKARAHQPVLDHLADPRRVGHIGLAARHVVKMLGVQQPALETVL